MKLPRMAYAVGLLLWSAIAFGMGLSLQAWLPLRTETSAVPTPSVVQQQLHPLLDEAWQLIETHALVELPPTTSLEHGAIRGLVSSIGDPHAQFNEPAQDHLVRGHLRGSFGGIGVRFVLNDAGQIVLTPLANGPAARAGVQNGDILLSVDGKALPSPARLEDAAGLQGEVGSTVTIEVSRNAQRLQFWITRELIRIPSVEWELTGDGQRVGWVRIHQFTEQTASELQETLRALKQHNTTAYILDLRDNSGGLLDAAVEVASQFIPEGVIAIEQSRGQAEQIFHVKRRESRLGLDKPLVVLVNQQTASAAEIVASAIQHHRRGRLVGTRTFGKGSVQRLFALSDGSSLRLTTSRWLTAGRQTLDQRGLMPDVEVEEASEQLRAAIRLLSEAVAQSR